MKKTHKIRLIVRKSWAICILAAAQAAMFCVSGAAAEDFVVKAVDQAGRGVKGIAVQLTLPSKDGKLDKDFDAVLSITDGVAVEGAKGKKTSETLDGKVSFPAAIVKEHIAKNQPYRIVCSAAGYAEYSQTFTYGGEKDATVTLPSLLRVEVKSKDGGRLPGARLVFGGHEIADGGGLDADGSPDGEINVAGDILKESLPRDIAIKIFLEGYKSQTRNVQIFLKSQQSISVVFERGDK